jgi:hypothetical protein
MVRAIVNRLSFLRALCDDFNSTTWRSAYLVTALHWVSSSLPFAKLIVACKRFEILCGEIYLRTVSNTLITVFFVHTMAAFAVALGGASDRAGGTTGNRFTHSTAAVICFRKLPAVAFDDAMAMLIQLMPLVALATLGDDCITNHGAVVTAAKFVFDSWQRALLAAADGGPISLFASCTDSVGLVRTVPSVRRARAIVCGNIALLALSSVVFVFTVSARRHAFFCARAVCVVVPSGHTFLTPCATPTPLAGC